MIALISFKDDIIMVREEAENLKLDYSECERVGLDGDRLTVLSSFNYYTDELTKGEDGSYYKDEEKITSWNIRQRPKNYLDWVLVRQANHLVDLEWFALNCTHPFYIEKSVRSEEPTVNNIQSLLNVIEEKTVRINETIELMTQQSFNQRAEVHVGGGLIATYNELMLKEDCCTDEMQGSMNEGWRIIAVCVQPDQRRPDYVLGRYNPTLDVTYKSSASR